jgi:hypothetical protein
VRADEAAHLLAHRAHHIGPRGQAADVGLRHGGGGYYQPCHANPRPIEKSSVE